MSPSWWTRDLYIGDQGPDVKHAQTLLSGQITGVYDEGTAALCRGFQAVHGLDPTGEVDEATASLMGERATKGLLPEWYLRLREVLGGVDDLSAAIRRVQSANRMVPTGVLDEATAIILGD